MKDLVPINAPAVPVPADDFQLLGPVDDHADQASSLRLKRFLTFLRKLWWVLLITLMLSLGGAAAWIRWRPATFVSVGRMWETVKLTLPEGAMFSEDVQSFLGTQAELLKSGRLQLMTMEALSAKGTNAVPKDAEGKPLKVKIKIVPAPKSTVFDIVATSSDQEYARAYLDSLMDQYLRYKKDVRQQVSGGTMASISDQVQKLEREVKAAQDAYNEFQRTNNLAVLEEAAKVAGGYLARLNTQLSDFALEQRILQATEAAQAASGATNAGVDLADMMRGFEPGAAAAASPERQTALKEVQMLTLQRERLSKYLRPKHPKMVKLQAQLDNAQKYVDLFRNQSRDQLAAAQQALKLKEQSVLASVKEWEEKVTQADARIAEADRLKQNVTRSQGIYDRLQALMQNVEVSKSIDQETLSILEPASPAGRTYKEELMALALAIFAGLALGIGIVFLVELRDDRLISLTEINEKVGQNVVAQLPAVRPASRKKPVPLLEVDDSRHVYAESYRNLRSAILFMATGAERPKTILFTSAVPSEGKSTVAANLARTLAMGGSRVVLVDCDLRKGVLHELMGKPASPGLTELLQNGATLDQSLQTNSLPNLALLPRGARSSHSGELFLSPAFDQLLARLRQQFDYVLLDSSPVFAADDAATLAPKMDGTIFVVRNTVSRARVVREALEQLYQRQAKVLGVIFNAANTSSKSYNYYKYADYHGGGKDH
jgi:capsular exopolysaccharide synthesis family protein